MPEVYLKLMPEVRSTYTNLPVDLAVHSARVPLTNKEIVWHVVLTRAKQMPNSKNAAEPKNGRLIQMLKLAFFNPDFSDKFGNQIIDYVVLDSLSARGPCCATSATVFLGKDSG